MPYYHVEVRYYEKIMESMNPESAYELDLTKAELMELIVKPYLEEHDFICGGTVILFSSINQITITESDKPSTNFISGSRITSEMRHLILNTRNVTRKFLPHPPSKKEITEKRKKTDQSPFLF